MSVHAKNNPFANVEVQKKREHYFAKNVENEEPVAKKSGRTMASKTKHHESTGKYARSCPAGKTEK